ncbi:IS200/IS605 family transposase [Sporosarcina ureilytica]|uniref:IS200/IS605 family transposase n=1 Tax=Sporosarcina ureilytica TaxID=298596 RepID=A0A1D8JK95_9BACL|nr:IS200/IS605 family transposase [Sporosarcina ureilytica]AOV09100.1 IS200/IS605 family transposase [Sporosarcina ureilytica]
MKTTLDKNKHSAYLLYFHLVLVVKYRRKAIDDEISEFLKSEFSRLGEPHGIILGEWNHDNDHVHMMFRSVPNVDISKVIMSYKSVSSRFVKQKYPWIKQVLWKNVFWPRSYCLLTTGGAPIDTIRKYIQSQRQQ